MKNTVVAMLSIAVFCLALAVIQLTAEVRRLEAAVGPAPTLESPDKKVSSESSEKIDTTMKCIIKKAKKWTKSAGEKISDLAD